MVRFKRDRMLVEEIYKRTGYKACTASLSIIETIWALKVTNVGLVTPYVGSIQEKIIRNFRLENFEFVSERHLNLNDNLNFSKVPANEISCASEEFIRYGAETVAVLCTNLVGAGICRRVENKTCVTMLDRAFCYLGCLPTYWYNYFISLCMGASFFQFVYEYWISYFSNLVNL